MSSSGASVTAFATLQGETACWRRLQEERALIPTANPPCVLQFLTPTLKLHFPKSASPKNDKCNNQSCMSGNNDGKEASPPVSSAGKHNNAGVSSLNSSISSNWQNDKIVAQLQHQLLKNSMQPLSKKKHGHKRKEQKMKEQRSESDKASGHEVG